MKLAQKLVIGYYKAKLNLFAKLSKRKAAEKAFELFCTPFATGKQKMPAVFEKEFTRGKKPTYFDALATIIDEGQMV